MTDQSASLPTASSQDPAALSPLRHVVIGVGAVVLKMHLPALQSEAVELVGVSDLDEVKGRARAAELGAPFYSDYQAMLAETRPDVAVIMTPHPFHAPITINCLQAGAHVLVEKPMAAQVAEADAMIEAAERAGRILAVSFQWRHRPDVLTARRLLQDGQLGQVQHVNLTATWTRTAAYYRSAAWRATWADEGGGVLMNQAPHHLDLLCFLLGPPARLTAWTRTRLHRIETEDTVQSLLEWADGALGVVHISTAGAGQPERLEIYGTAGCLRIEQGILSVETFEQDLREYVLASNEFFTPPAQRRLDVRVPPGQADHPAVYRDFHRAIRDGRPPAAHGASARCSLELANAMTYSSYTRSQVELPLDRLKYAELLERLRTGTGLK